MPSNPAYPMAASYAFSLTRPSLSFQICHLDLWAETLLNLADIKAI
jgi:hypothetical protein